MEKKTERLIVRLTKEELEKLKEIADIEEKSVSDVIRGLIKFRANHYEKNHQTRVPTTEARKRNVEFQNNAIDDNTLDEFKRLFS